MCPVSSRRSLTDDADGAVLCPPWRLFRIRVNKSLKVRAVDHRAQLAVALLSWAGRQPRTRKLTHRGRPRLVLLRVTVTVTCKAFLDRCGSCESVSWRDVLGWLRAHGAEREHRCGGPDFNRRWSA